MTCQVLIKSPDGLIVEAQGILDSASSASFITERLSQNLRLPLSHCDAKISGIAGLSHTASKQSIATFEISPVHAPNNTMSVSAIVVPHVTCNLLIVPIPFDSRWNHISDIRLADPRFGIPDRIDLLLGVDIFATCSVLRQGRRSGPPDTPLAFETAFGWVLAGNTNCTSNEEVISHHVSVATAGSDDILRKFWEIEETMSIDDH